MRSFTSALAGAAVTAIVVSGSIAIAAIPDSTTKVITVCYTKTSGALRLIDKQAKATCNTKTEIELSWNQQGVKGDAGPQGLLGLTGPAGANGAKGSVGPVGPAGTNGTNGATGPEGSMGANGPQGPAGPVGPAGANGVDGAQGPVGSQGPIGEPGGFYLKDANGVLLGRIADYAMNFQTWIVWTGTSFMGYRPNGDLLPGGEWGNLYFTNAGCTGTPYVRSSNANTQNYGLGFALPMLLSGHGASAREIATNPPEYINAIYTEDGQGNCSYNSVGSWGDYSTFSVVATYEQVTTPLSASATP